MMCSTHFRRIAGFSLVELMVVVALITIMSTAAVTGLMQLVHTVRVKSAAQTLFSTMLLARSEAAKRNANVTITPVDEDDWAAGWDLAAGAELILRQEALRGVVVTLGPDEVVFNHHGRLPDGAVAPQFQFQSSSGDTSVTRCIVVDVGGRPSAFKGECA